MGAMFHKSMMVANESYAMRPRHSEKLKASIWQHAANFWQLTFTQHFRHYLLGRRVTLVKDHRALHGCTVSRTLMA